MSEFDDFSRPFSWREWATVIGGIVATYPVLVGLMILAGA